MEKQEGEMEIGGTATVQSAGSVIGGHDLISFGLSNNDTNLTKAKGIEIKDSEAISKKNGINVTTINPNPVLEVSRL